MKKIVFALMVAVVAMPALAQEVKAPMGNKDIPSMEMKRDHKAFKKAREEHKAQLKVMKEKMEKLVKEYNKLTDGAKKDAKRAEIAKEVSAIHEKQLEFKKDQLAKFEGRLTRMKAKLAEENSATQKAEWVNQKTDALIKANGNLKALFDRPGMRETQFGMKGKGLRKGFMHKGPRPNGPRPAPAN